MRSVELLPTRKAVQNKLYYPILTRKEYNEGVERSGKSSAQGQDKTSISRNSHLQQVFDKLYEPQIPSSSGCGDAASWHIVHRVRSERSPS